MAAMTECVDSDSSDKFDLPKSDFNVDASYNLEEDTNTSLSLEGSVVASPSIESFSTLPDGENSLSLADTENDLIVRVDNPQKQADLLETFITFRVSTKTSREGFQAPAYSVRRRYNDFAWLRQHLVHGYPTHFVPALPLKHSLMGQFDRYGREFVTARMAALQVFLSRIVNHPILSFAPCFKCFLTANAEEFQDLRKFTTASLISKVSESWKSLSTLHIETHRPLELTKLNKYLNDLSEKLNYLCRISQRIHRERSEQVKDLRELKPALQRWGGSDADLTHELCIVANAVDKCEQSLQAVLLDTDNILVAQPLKEYILYVDAIKEALTRRDEMEVELIYRQELLEKKKQELAGVQQDSSETGLRAWVKTFETRDDKIQRLTQNVSLSQTAVEESRDRLECANENIRADADRWAEEKKTDLKNILLAFSDQHISYYEQCGQAWDDVVNELQKSANPPVAESSSHS